MDFSDKNTTGPLVLPGFCRNGRDPVSKVDLVFEANYDPHSRALRW
jgi:hypothetical protein